MSTPHHDTHGAETYRPEAENTPTTTEVPRLVSPKRGKAVFRADAERLEKYMILHGGRLEISEETYETLKNDYSISRSRVPACICNLRQLYGRNIISERNGRRVSAYVLLPSSHPVAEPPAAPSEIVEPDTTPTELVETTATEAEPNDVPVSGGWLQE